MVDFKIGEMGAKGAWDAALWLRWALQLRSSEHFLWYCVIFHARRMPGLPITVNGLT